MDRGASILEVLIAIAILTLAISAAVMLSFASQSLEVDTDTSHEALFMAKEVLEEARADSRENFNSVVDSLPTLTDIYTNKLLVRDDTTCRKTATSTITWNVSPLRTQTIELTTIFTDVAGSFPKGGDCDFEPVADWDNPITAASVGIGGQGATDIDVLDSIIYITSDPSASSKDDFFIYQFDSSTLTLTELSSFNIIDGLVSLISLDTADNIAYIANGETTRQLMIMSVSDKSNPEITASTSLPFMTTGRARSIFYLDNKVYIGTQYLACPPTCDPEQNNELHIYDVSDPYAPVWLGSENVNHNVNDIVVRGDYAYIASSDNNGELRIYNISNPADITFTGLFDANLTASDIEDGLSLYLIGNKIYLGRERASNPSEKDFYVIDITDPSSPAELGSKNLGLNPGTDVVGVVVKGKLAFLGLDNPISGFKILNISNLSNIIDHIVCTTLNFSENTSALDMENNFVFTANQSNDEIRVIHDQLSQCAP